MTSEEQQALTLATQRAEAKARRHAVHPHPKQFTRRGVTITLVDGPTMNGTDVMVSVQATTADGLVVLPVDNPYLFRNPPLNHNGQEDVGAAFQEILVDAVLHVAAQRGIKVS